MKLKFEKREKEFEKIHQDYVKEQVKSIFHEAIKEEEDKNKYIERLRDELRNIKLNNADKNQKINELKIYPIVNPFEKKIIREDNEKLKKRIKEDYAKIEDFKNNINKNETLISYYKKENENLKEKVSKFNNKKK